ncbi:MAG TPA: efflux RND transporter periplasmic adaptor subunit [Rhodocyclaceae bacterium]|nr:efflux RND transporter periplasmic adaptor subunit [Rhodocyclaceae bacterium]
MPSSSGDSHRRRLATRRIVLSVVSILIVIVLIALYSCSAHDKAPDQSAAPKPALAVTTASLQQHQWPELVLATGNIAAWREVIIGTELSGLRLEDVMVDVGDKVTHGQLLATLQDQTQKADLAQTNASLAEAKATLAEASANADRARQLQASGALSAQQIDQYVTAEQTARAQVDSFAAHAQTDELHLSQTHIFAPDDGIISAREATVGAVVQPGQELFHLIRQQRLEWRAEVDSAELLQIKPGMPVFVVGASGKKVKGTVRVAAPTVDPQSRNGLVYVDLARSDDVRAGMFARGEFDVGHSSALTLPQSAVLLRDGFSYVLRVDTNNKVAQTKVATGRRMGNEIEITGGLQPGVAVVASGAGFLSDGDVIRIVPAVPADNASSDQSASQAR